MFTGIITDLGSIAAVTETVPGKRDRKFRIATAYDMATVDDGASIACSGACLTVIAKGKGWFEVDVSEETISKTTLADWKAGAPINLERSLKLGDELGGHIVAGHVDGIAAIVTRDNLPDMAKFELRAPRELARFIAAKGSVTLDGVSLTVNSAVDDTFSVLIIPHTLQVTTLSNWRAGSQVNLEIDLMARYAARLSEMK